MTTAPGMIHTVYFWLKPEVDAASRADFARGADALASAPTVLQYYGGGPAATPARDVTDHSFDYCIHLFFADEAAHEAYQVDPIHLKFVDEQADKFGTVKVLDNLV